MTVEQRLEHLEQQNQRTQRTNKRLTVALAMTVVAMVPTGEKNGVFDTYPCTKRQTNNNYG